MPSDEQLELSIVIPVYGSESTLAPLTDRLIAVLEGLDRSYEIVFVDDCSPDGAWAVLCDLQARHGERIQILQLMRNFGQHNALMCGLRHARGRRIVTMDDDLQNPPEEIPKLLDAMESGGWDVVYGQFGGKRHAAWRNLGSWVVNCFYRLVFRSRCRVTSFRALRRDVVDAVLPYDLNFTYIDGLLAWNTEKISSVPVEHCPRGTGRSGYSLAKLLTLSFNLFTNFSLLPLQVVSLCGFGIALSGFVLGTYYLILYSLDRITVPGYASLIVAVLMLGGAQLLALGIMGEYLGRLHLNVNRKPQYTIRQVRHTPTAHEPGRQVAPDHGPAARSGY